MNPTAPKTAWSLVLLIFAVLPASAQTSKAVSADAALTGRVIYADGRPAFRVQVVAQIQDEAEMTWLQKQPQATWNSLMRTVDEADTVTGPDGSYRIHVAPHFPYNIMVNLAKPPSEDDRNAQWIAAAKEGAVGGANKTTRLTDFVLTKGVFVTGLVTDRATGAPISGVHIGGYGPSRPDTSAMGDDTVTDSAGRYRLRVLPGSNEVYVSDGRYNSRTTMQSRAAGLLKTIRVARGQNANVSFRVSLNQKP